MNNKEAWEWVRERLSNLQAEEMEKYIDTSPCCRSFYTQPNRDKDLAALAAMLVVVNALQSPAPPADEDNSTMAKILPPDPHPQSWDPFLSPPASCGQGPQYDAAPPVAPVRVTREEISRSFIAPDAPFFDSWEALLERIIHLFRNKGVIVEEEGK